MVQLTERQYQYLLLRTEGLKLREIADIFEVTVQSVAEVCTRAMDHLGRSMNA
jgi:transcriptional regulator